MTVNFVKCELYTEIALGIFIVYDKKEIPFFSFDRSRKKSKNADA